MPLNRYFPEVVAAVGKSFPRRCVIDGEIVVALNGRLEFERLLERIHPAKSRVDMLAEKTPALLVAFDILALDDESLVDQPLKRRREALESAMSAAVPPIHLTQATRDHATAQEWLGQFEGAGLDGVIAKPMTSIYEPAARGSWYKIKHDRTADVVVAGYRLHKTSTPEKPLLGSLLLGLYDDSGTLQHIGVSAAFAAARRAELLDELRPLEIEAADHPWGAWAEAEGSEGGRRPGAVSRWNAGKDLSWTPLDPVLVCEVGYDHMEGTRFRHTAQFKRWRPDRDPSSCTYEQLEEVQKYDLAEVLT